MRLCFILKKKFKSRTGWPSFTEPIKENVIQYLSDNSFRRSRVEVECGQCDAHLGHVFNDGPKSTGLCYSINSASLNKITEEKKEIITEENDE